MDDIQNQLNSGSSLPQTQNPQTAPAQDLGSGQNNLQTSNSDLLRQTNLKITGVKTVKTVALPQNNQVSPTSSSVLPLLLAFIIGIVILAGLVILAVKKGQSPQK